MTFAEMAAARQSTRKYKIDPVEPEKLKAILETARLAPSACNSQPWKFIAVSEDPALSAVRDALHDGVLPINRFVRDCPAFVVIAETPAKLSELVAQKHKNTDFVAMDIGIAAAHIVYAAQDLGLSTCIIGWMDEPKMKAALGIPENLRVRLAVAVGYAADGEAQRPKKRKPAEEVFSFNGR